MVDSYALGVSRRAALLAALVSAAALASSAPETERVQPADLILTGARVWTAETKSPWAEAVAVRGDRIVYVGDARGAEALRGPKTDVRELKGRLVLPGFNDAHVHLTSGAQSLERVDLIEDESLPAVQSRIKAFAAANPKSAWVLGRGWFYSAFPGGLPTREQLDAVVPDRPPTWSATTGTAAGRTRRLSPSPGSRGTRRTPRTA